MYRENAPKNPSELLTLQPNAAGFLADADRFHSDTAGEEFLQRKAMHSRKQVSRRNPPCYKKITKIFCIFSFFLIFMTACLSFAPMPPGNLQQHEEQEGYR